MPAQNKEPGRGKVQLSKSSAQRLLFKELKKLSEHFALFEFSNTCCGMPCGRDDKGSLCSVWSSNFDRGNTCPRAALLVVCFSLSFVASCKAENCIRIKRTWRTMLCSFLSVLLGLVSPDSRIQQQ